MDGEALGAHEGSTHGNVPWGKGDARIAGAMGVSVDLVRTFRWRRNIPCLWPDRRGGRRALEGPGSRTYGAAGERDRDGRAEERRRRSEVEDTARVVCSEEAR